MIVNVKFFLLLVIFSHCFQFQGLDKIKLTGPPGESVSFLPSGNSF